MSAASSQAGQSLLEITISIGIAIVVVAALTTTTINGLKNSQFSQNQAQATKLAQQGLEGVKAIKSRNCPVKVGLDSYYWSEITPLVWGVDFNLPQPKIFEPVLTSTTCELIERSSPVSVGTIFGRQVSLENVADPNEKKVISKVTWQDFSGSHQSELVTIIANY